VVIDKTSLKIAPDVAKVDVASPPSLSFDEESGWIMLQLSTLPTNEKMRHLCWLPVELRGSHFATHNERIIVIASDSTHQLTIIDMGPMLDMLRGMGVV
jgi:hypothetical protein